MELRPRELGVPAVAVQGAFLPEPEKGRVGTSHWRALAEEGSGSDGYFIPNYAKKGAGQEWLRGQGVGSQGQLLTRVFRRKPAKVTRTNPGRGNAPLVPGVDGVGFWMGLSEFLSGPATLLISVPLHWYPRTPFKGSRAFSLWCATLARSGGGLSPYLRFFSLQIYGILTICLRCSLSGVSICDLRGSGRTERASGCAEGGCWAGGPDPPPAPVLRGLIPRFGPTGVVFAVPEFSSSVTYTHSPPLPAAGKGLPEGGGVTPRVPHHQGPRWDPLRGLVLGPASPRAGVSGETSASLPGRRDPSSRPAPQQPGDRLGTDPGAHP